MEALAAPLKFVDSSTKLIIKKRAKRKRPKNFGTPEYHAHREKNTAKARECRKVSKAKKESNKLLLDQLVEHNLHLKSQIEALEAIEARLFEQYNRVVDSKPVEKVLFNDVWFS